MKEKVIVLGSRGMAGHVISTYLKETGKYIVIDVARDDSANYNIDVEKQLNKLEDAINKEKPDVIINCIGLLVKDSEKYPERAIYLNSYLPHWLNKVCKEINCYLIHISTDCVFSGNKKRYFVDSEKDGVGIYAKTKGLGEVIDYDYRTLTIRTSIIGPELKDTGVGLFDWFMRQKETCEGYLGVLWNGITTPALARFIDVFILAPLSGIVNLSINKPISKYDLLQKIAKEFKKDIKIVKNNKTKCTKVLVPSDECLTKLLNYKYKNYNMLIEELVKWIDSHKNLYGGKYYGNR